MLSFHLLISFLFICKEKRWSYPILLAYKKHQSAFPQVYILTVILHKPRSQPCSLQPEHTRRSACFLCSLQLIWYLLERAKRTGWARRAHLLCPRSAAGWMHWFCWVKNSYLVLGGIILLSAGGVMWFVILKSSMEMVVCFSSCPYTSAQWENQTAFRSFRLLWLWSREMEVEIHSRNYAGCVVVSGDVKNLFLTFLDSVFVLVGVRKMWRLRISS